MKLYLILIAYIMVVNVIGYLIMYIDKKRAIEKAYRISEKSIFLTALLLGATGVYAGMCKFRHKTKHTKFIVLIPFLIFINIISVVLLILYVFPYFK